MTLWTTCCDLAPRTACDSHCYDFQERFSPVFRCRPLHLSLTLIDLPLSLIYTHCLACFPHFFLFRSSSSLWHFSPTPEHKQHPRPALLSRSYFISAGCTSRARIFVPLRATEEGEVRITEVKCAGKTSEPCIQYIQGSRPGTNTVLIKAEMTDSSP